MFKTARIKLTGWYLLIIMAISISFSVAMYRVLSSELDRLERAERLRVERRLPEFQINPPSTGVPSVILDPELLAETKNRVEIILILINVFILGGSAFAGYMLAGRTLNPIAEMVDEQNRFITDASHELRTPLTSLKSEIEVNLRDPGMSLDQAKKLLQSNLEEVNSLKVLSYGLIKLTQYQKGQNGLPITNVSLAAIAKEAIRKISSAAKEKRITIVNTVHSDAIEGNQQALTELLVIFLDNAVKYSPKQTKIHLTSQKTDGHVCIKIADQGVGIDEKDIPNLFDRFYRADISRTKSDVSGYGLGLAIAKQIVDKHAGVIHVKSKRKEGSTFIVELPIKHSAKLM